MSGIKTVQDPASWFAALCASVLESVFSQALGNPWTAGVPETARDEAEEAFIFRLSGAVAGMLAFRLRRDDGSVLARAFMGEASTEPVEFTAEHRECLEELLRQVGGNWSSTLRAEIGETRFELVAEPFTGEPLCFAIPLQGTVAVRIALDLAPDLVASLQAAKTGTAETSQAAASETSSNEQAAPSAELAVASATTPGNLDLLLDIELPATLRFGQKKMRLQDVLQLAAGAVVDLDRHVEDPVELLVDGHLIARGEVVIVGGHYGLRVVEVAGAPARVAAIS